MPSRLSYLKARYCRAVLKTALSSPEDEARRLVDALASELPTKGASSDISEAEQQALAAFAKMAERVRIRGAASIASHWVETNGLIERWIEAADLNLFERADRGDRATNCQSNIR